MKKFVIRTLDATPAVVIVALEGALMYIATGTAKSVFTQINPLCAAWYRFGFLALLMLLWRRPWRREVRHTLPSTRRDWLITAGCGFAIVAMNTMFYLAISQMNMGMAVAIEFVGPLGVAVITGRNWRERVGILIAAVGVVLLAGMSLASPDGGHFLVGLIAILTGGTMWGIYIVLGRQVANTGSPLNRLSIAMCIGFAIQSVFLAVPAIRGLFVPPQTATWLVTEGEWGILHLLLLMLVVSVFSSFFPYVIDQVVMRKTTPGTFSVMQSMYPAMAVAVGLLFAEFPTIWELIGVGCVMLAVVVTFSGTSRVRHPVGHDSVDVVD
ncbi:EamA family transporter [Bifidobacterium callimiconis]|uniref:Threonine transporter RhtB n=1 Tax=Bifidobacterium callimiconis TaxID=2306973 RepID=A0A430FHV1_9BIFI|nr:EamA family transporter [Bifidobacterium callimiconis]RSX52463.1 threonine transporter RhtB [Bifidobacterium callimiconis]